MIAIAVAALTLAGDPSVQPWRIGPGPRYQPPATSAAVAAGRALGALQYTPGGRSYQVHLELYANRRVVVLPAGIGVARPSARVGAEVVPGGCLYPARTLTPAGIVEIANGARLRLGDLFRIWGQPLGKRRLASFRSGSPVRAYVGGRRVDGPVGAIRLTPHAQIVLELGPYVPPHPSFLFPGDAS